MQYFNFTNQTIKLQNLLTKIIQTPDINTNYSVIDDDFFKLAVLINKELIVAVQPIYIKVDLHAALTNSIKKSDPHIFNLIINNDIDVSKIEKQILIMLYKYDMINELKHVYNMGYRDDNLYFYVAEKGDLDLLIYLLDKYTHHASSNNPDTVLSTDLIGRIVVKAIMTNKKNIVQHFFPYSVFPNVPDQVVQYINNAIKYGADPEIIQYFIDGGVSIKTNNYFFVRTAIECDRLAIIRYFYQIDQTIISIMTANEIKMFLPNDQEPLKMFIGENEICCIEKDNIKINDKFYVCENKHYVKQLIWNKWLTNKNAKNVCPCCTKNMNNIVYVNSNQ